MATCTKCGKDNRAEAKYCRFCGEKFEVQISETSLIGKQNIEPELEKLEQKLKVAKILAQGGTRIDLDCLILGDAGSGKHFIAKTIASKIIASGVAKQGIKEVDAADWDQFSSDFDKNISSLKDGILLITNAQKLLPTSKSSDVNQLDKLFARMRTVEGAPIVLLCGHMNDLSGFLENNKDVRRLFGFEFRLEPFSNNDLCILTSSMLKERYKLDSLSEDGLENMEAIAMKRGFILSGKRIDYERCAKTVLDEFRGGIIGHITLEKAQANIEKGQGEAK